MSELHVTTYGVGGFDPSVKDHNVVKTTVVIVEPRPLDPVGVLATLLAVAEVVSVDDAANAVGLTPAELVAEAQAWGMNNG